jgi:hypothetical protein
MGSGDRVGQGRKASGTRDAASRPLDRARASGQPQSRNGAGPAARFRFVAVDAEGSPAVIGELVRACLKGE